MHAARLSFPLWEMHIFVFKDPQHNDPCAKARKPQNWRGLPQEIHRCAGQGIQTLLRCS